MGRTRGLLAEIAEFEVDAAKKAGFEIDAPLSAHLRESNAAIVAIAFAGCGMGHQCALVRGASREDRTARAEPRGASREDRRDYFFAHVGGSSLIDCEKHDERYRGLSAPPVAARITLPELLAKTRGFRRAEDYLALLSEFPPQQ